MDFRLDEEQMELRDTIRRFCATRFASDRIGDREGRGVDRDAWREMAELGLFGLLLPEADGGVGTGVVEAAVAFEQLGEHLATGPILWTVLSARHVDGAATGARVVTGIEKRASNDDGVLLLEHGDEADAVLVVRHEGVFRCEATALGVRRSLPPFDPLTPVVRVDRLPEGERVGDAAAAADVRGAGTVLSAALLVGIAEAALQASRTYALDREQFGAPIGTFQAIQHMLADMYVKAALARSSVYAAAAVLDDPAVGDADRAGSAAKLLAGEAARENARAAIQIHGGMGFTWEMLPHYLLKRAWALAHVFGETEEHALALGETMMDSVG